MQRQTLSSNNATDTVKLFHDFLRLLRLKGEAARLSKGASVKANYYINDLLPKIALFAGK